MTAYVSAATDVRSTVRVSTRIVRAEPVTRESWLFARQRSERIFVERDGTKVLLRTIDHE
jgi:hypothetical protein